MNVGQDGILDDSWPTSKFLTNHQSPIRLKLIDWWYGAGATALRSEQQELPWDLGVLPSAPELELRQLDHGLDWRLRCAPILQPRSGKDYYVWPLDSSQAPEAAAGTSFLVSKCHTLLEEISHYPFSSMFKQLLWTANESDASSWTWGGHCERFVPDGSLAVCFPCPWSWWCWPTGST